MAQATDIDCCRIHDAGVVRASRGRPSNHGRVHGHKRGVSDSAIRVAICLYLIGIVHFHGVFDGVTRVATFT